MEPTRAGLEHHNAPPVRVNRLFLFLKCFMACFGLVVEHINALALTPIPFLLPLLLPLLTLLLLLLPLLPLLLPLFLPQVRRASAGGGGAGAERGEGGI